MARERWFYAQARQRRGPVLLPELVECVLGQPDPGAVLVWRKGLPEWTRVADVPEVQERIAPVVARREADDAAARRTSAPVVETVAAPAAAPAPPPAGSNVAVYGGIAAGLVVLGLLAWFFWPRQADPAQPVPLGGPTAENAPAVVLPPGPAPGEPASAAPVAPARPPAAVVAVQESELPVPELRKLRGVAAWAGDRLKLTVYNGTAWRVTEVSVRVARFDGNDLVEDQKPVRLMPPGAKVDEGVADLLSKVAPDRRKPGLNALDTGPFEGRVGAQPESFRWQIESARGYAPQ